MQLTKYKITASKSPGYMMVVYQDSHFKSVLNEFKPYLNEQQLNILLNLIPDDPNMLETLINAKYQGRIMVEMVKPIGNEPGISLPEYPVNEKVALFCELYEAALGIKYKAGAADIGKLKALAITPEDFRFILETYFVSDEWYIKEKSVANFIKKFNEVRVLAYSKPKKREFPIPYDELYYARLDTMGKRDYHAYLREQGYRWEANPGRGGKWVNY